MKIKYIDIKQAECEQEGFWENLIEFIQKKPNTIGALKHEMIESQFKIFFTSSFRP